MSLLFYTDVCSKHLYISIDGVTQDIFCPLCFQLYRTYEGNLVLVISYSQALQIFVAFLSSKVKKVQNINYVSLSFIISRKFRYYRRANNLHEGTYYENCEESFS